MPWIKPVKQKEMKELNVQSHAPHPAPLFDRLLAHDEKLYEAFLPLQKAIKETNMPDDLREAVITFVSMKNGCKYCTDSHSKLLKELVDKEDVLGWLSNYKESGMNEEWKAVLMYAEHLIDKPVKVTKADVERLKEHGYDAQNIAALNQTVAYTSYTNQLSMGLGL
ncbi:carboxymuconolactone decarboxylase family protein [Halobacillus sp. GSS1]|uniref:carboxymuconolactone decarboxylase family protein n=1 Tax=Halobacillus sp. GSS1 TaxID=2815919 RepID=UPI001A8F16C2|nr:carboxymuconolactone decarboxylase family protein [Halobacillus sp. GSS1]MBN9654639.1 carboxymuconolactone decarboxylase family protein [Halobacillus sp. GSS1]